MNGIGVINASGHPAIAGSFHTLVVQPTNFGNLDCSCCYLQTGSQSRLQAATRLHQMGIHPGVDNGSLPTIVTPG